MVLIRRYIFHRTVPKNFWCFRRVKNNSTEEMQKCIKEEINPIIMKTLQKLIAQICNGANVMSGATGGVQNYIQNKYPYTH